MKEKIIIWMFIILFISDSFCVNAQWVHKSGNYQNQVWDIAVKDSNIFAATPDGVFLYGIGDNNWVSINSGITTNNILSLTVNGDKTFAGTFGKGVFLSTNNGSNWTAVNNGLTIRNINDLVVNVTGNELGDTSLFAAAYDYLLGGGVFRSTNNGINWIAINSGLTNLEVRALAVKDKILFAGTAGGVFRSTDNGTNWTAVNSGLITFYISSLAASGENLFAGTTGGGVYRSSNNGTNWVQANNGLTNFIVNALAVAPKSDYQSGNKVFAGTGWSGVFLSLNNGDSWAAVNTGMTSSLINCLAFTEDYIFAGTDSGLWCRPLSELTNVDLFSDGQKQFQLLQNYPNPFNPSTTIKYIISKPGLVQLNVYDMLGREVVALVNEFQIAGEHSVIFSADNKHQTTDNKQIASGIYFYRLKAGEFVSTKKLIFLK